MELLPYPSVMEKLREKRRSLPITQKEVAHRAGTSPAQLSRMENANAEAKYSTVYSVWETLQKAETDSQETAQELCTENITWVTTEQTIRSTRKVMLDNAYSQLPVRDPDPEETVGSITERTLLAIDDVDQPINGFIESPFLEIFPHTNRSAIEELLRDDNDALLVQSETNGYQGIITTADII